MSGLARLLAGHTSPGVYHWATGADSDLVQHAAERAGWRFICLDTWQIEDKAEFLQACKGAFGIEDLAEHSFDGLADALNDVQPATPPGSWCSGTAGHRSPGPTAMRSTSRSMSSTLGSTRSGGCVRRSVEGSWSSDRPRGARPAPP